MGIAGTTYICDDPYKLMRLEVYPERVATSTEVTLPPTHIETFELRGKWIEEDRVELPLAGRIIVEVPPSVIVSLHKAESGETYILIENEYPKLNTIGGEG